MYKFCFGGLVSSHELCHFSFKLLVVKFRLKFILLVDLMLKSGICTLQGRLVGTFFIALEAYPDSDVRMSQSNHYGFPFLQCFDQ